MSNISIPYDDLLNPVLQALRNLGNSGTIHEIHDETVKIRGLTPEQIEKPFGKGISDQTDIKVRLSYTRTWLKKYGVLNNPTNGVWILTEQGKKTEKVVPAEVQATVARLEKIRKKRGIPELNEEWREILYASLIQMEPDAFERLCQRMLRESGFTEVTVTGQSGDGGIDGIGVMRISGFLSFRVLFQCKRWKGSVGPGTVRDFRGAMTGRTDKGLIVTTGRFTSDAVCEARRKGAPEIDLVDGEQLVGKLKELSLGVRTQQVITEEITIDQEFFSNI